MRDRNIPTKAIGSKKTGRKASPIRPRSGYARTNDSVHIPKQKPETTVSCAFLAGMVNVNRS
jgi:hypothetical protein